MIVLGGQSGGDLFVFGSFTKRKKKQSSDFCNFICLSEFILSLSLIYSVIHPEPGDTEVSPLT